MTLRKLLVEDRIDRIELTWPGLEATGCEVRLSKSALPLSSLVKSFESNALITFTGSPDRDTLEQICAMSGNGLGGAVRKVRGRMPTEAGNTS
jgi:hypothetical protein